MLEGGRDNRVRGPSRGEWSPWVVEPDQKTREGEARRGEHLQVSNLHVPDGSSVAGAGGGRVVYLVGTSWGRQVGDTLSHSQAWFRSHPGTTRFLSEIVRPCSGAILATRTIALNVVLADLSA